MKRGREIYFIMTVIMFIVIYLTSNILGGTRINIGSLTASITVFIYPITYFVIILVKERYGKQEAFNLLSYAVFSLIVYALIVTLVGVFPVDSGKELLNIDYRVIFASITAFFITHMLHLFLYNYLNNNKVINFLISSVLSISVNTILFIGLSFVGTMPINDLILLFAGEFIINVLVVCLLSLCFRSCIYEIIDAKIREDEQAIKESDNIVVKEVIKKVSKPRSKTKKS